MVKSICREGKFFMEIIARIHTDFKTKFGLPRQSGIVEAIPGEIVFEKPYRDEAALRGLEDFSHIWLIWQFSESKKEKWSPTVRPPLLGGNKRMGVFATRSPFRPNPIGLSCVRLEKIYYDKKRGPVILVSGCDLMDGTPIYDIKPYLPYCDAHTDAVGGFTENLEKREVAVIFPEELLRKIPESKRELLLRVLSGDPRPPYQNDPERVYGFFFADFEVKFTVSGGTLTVQDVAEVNCVL